VEKIKQYHAVADESGHYRAQTPGLQAHRVTRVRWPDVCDAYFILRNQRCWCATILTWIASIV